MTANTFICPNIQDVYLLAKCPSKCVLHSCIVYCQLDPVSSHITALDHNKRLLFEKLAGHCDPVEHLITRSSAYMAITHALFCY